MTRVLTVFEHESISISDSGGGRSLSPAEAERLLELGDERAGFCQRRHRSIKLAQHAGLVNLGGRMLEILPKVARSPGEPERCRRLLLRMLQLARSVPLHRDVGAQHDLRRASLLDVFITAFLDQVSTLIRGGLLRQYRTDEDDLRVVRGRLLISQQATRNAMRSDRVACRYDELSADNVLNRSVKAALDGVRPWIASTDLGRRWIELSSAFDEVPHVPMRPKDVSSIVLDRQGARYRTALQWAAWILALLSPNLRAGKEKAPGLLFDMNKLFEASVVTVLRRQAAPNERIGVQARKVFLARIQGTNCQAVELIPDIVVSRDGEIVKVADTKWKVLELDNDDFASPKPPDLYQLNAYATAYSCRDFEIYYPTHAGLTQMRDTTFEVVGDGAAPKRIRVVAIDLESAPRSR